VQRSKILPGWAADVMEGWRNPPHPWVSIDDDMDHRREAFYRLYQAAGPDVAAMWAGLEQRLATEDRADFIYRAILATDEIVANEPLPIYGVTDHPRPTLRTSRQRLARKLAEQVQLLTACTPLRCIADTVVRNQAGSIVERLIIGFSIGQVPRDYDQRWRLSRLGIEYTTSSKRGWVQHRRASDLVRTKVVELARKLVAEEGGAADLRWLAAFADELASLPCLEKEHGGDLMLASQKAGYLDWFRPVYRESLHYSVTPGESPLSIAGWATLAVLMTNDPDINADDIAHAIRACQIL